VNGAQDMGGMMGFGPVLPEPNEPVFHAEWEKRALAVTLAAGALGQWNIDMSRAARESLHPAFYLTRGYYEIWIAALEALLAAKGLVSAREIAEGRALTAAPATKPPLRAVDVEPAMRRGSPYDRPAPSAPTFAVGESVRTQVMHPATHTRLPRYARGKTGVVEAVRGCFVFPDSNALERGEDPHWCYTIRFSGRELWGADADPTLAVSIDAWEPYLERA
jgi:nitrile hydratase beta subunit